MVHNEDPNEDEYEQILQSEVEQQIEMEELVKHFALVLNAGENIFFLWNAMRNHVGMQV
jgi:hypothetical protein